MDASHIEKFDAWLLSAGVRDYFSPREFGRLHNARWKGLSWELPPESLWENIRGAIEIAYAVREAWGSPVVIVSSWRPLLYNRLVGSTDTSMHVSFRALDLRPANGKYKKFESLVERIVLERRAAGDVVGFGRYPKSSTPFVHVDTGYYARSRTWGPRAA